MKKIWCVIKREYLQRVRSRTFVIMTALGPLIMIGYLMLVISLARMESAEVRTIAIWNPDPALAESFSRGISRYSRDAIRVKKLDANPLASEQSKAQLFDQIRKEKLNGFVYIPADVTAEGLPEYYSTSTGNVVQNQVLENALNKSVIEIRLNREGVASGKVQSLLKPTHMKTVRVTKTGTRRDDTQAFVAGFAFVFILYMVILIYGISIMRSVIEEKSSRIVEVILSSLRPMQLLTGKLLGVGAVALTQVAIWVTASSLVSLYGAAAYASLARPNSSFQFSVPLPLLGYFMLFFVLGFFLYSTLYAAVGALVTSEQEAQHYQMPVLVSIILAMVLVNVIIKNPNSGVSVALSLFPMFSPILMFMRIVVQTPPIWQIALAVASMLFGIWIALWISSKIYRVGILMYGKPPSLPEVVRWLRYA